MMMAPIITKADGTIRSIMDKHSHELEIFSSMDDEQVEEFLLEAGIFLRFEDEYTLSQAVFNDLNGSWLCLAQRHRGHEEKENGYCLIAVNLNLIPREVAVRIIGGTMVATSHGPGKVTEATTTGVS
jgi:hypothetical protein